MSAGEPIIAVAGEASHVARRVRDFLEAEAELALQVDARLDAEDMTRLHRRAVPRHQARRELMCVRKR